MDSLRRLQCYTRMELRLKQRADGFADDEFEAMCQKELFRIIGKAISEMPEQVIPLTPSTSFDFRSSCGIATERALIYELLRRREEFTGLKQELSEFMRVGVKWTTTGSQGWKRSLQTPSRPCLFRQLMRQTPDSDIRGSIRRWNLSRKKKRRPLYCTISKTGA